MERRNRTRKKDEKEQRRRAQRLAIKVRLCLFFFYFYFSSSRSSFFALCPRDRYLSGVLGLPKDAYNQTTKSWAVVSLCPRRYFNHEVDISFSRFHSCEYIHLLTILYTVKSINTGTRARTGVRPEEIKTAKRTTATLVKREHARMEAARELRKICLRGFR